MVKARAPAAVLFLATLGTCMLLHAQPYPVPPTWGGDLATRPRLTGDWGGLRDELGKNGIVIDADLYWLPQKVVGGGRDHDGASWGNFVATLNADTQKLGLWPGGFLNVQTVTSFGNSVYRDTGSLVPANEAWMVPALSNSGQPNTGVQSITYMQFLSENFGLMAGKLNLLQSSNQFFGDYRTGFQNTAINLPMALALVPLSAYGAGALYLPTQDITLVAMALDPDGTVKSSDLGDAFGHGVMALGSANLKIKPFGLPGHQSLTLAWSNKDRTSLIQDPSNIARMLLTGRFPALGNPGPILTEIIAALAPGLLVPIEPLNQEKKTWAVVYGFEQFLWQPAGDSKRGVGAFFNFGVSDGKANPVKRSYSLGLVGKGMVPGRPGDNIGIGWASTKFSDNFAPFLRETFNLGLERENTLELYYSAAITPWLNVSPSLQVVNPALNKMLDSSGTGLKSLDTAYVAGVRIGVRF